jgi:phosphinothricin acetyltransferase
VLIRHAEPERDAGACAEIYAPYVRDTAVSFEDEPPDARELRRRIECTERTHPWLVAETAGGGVAGYAYATAHRDRAAYRWAADVAVYVAPDQQGQGIGTRLYGDLLPLLARQMIRIAVAGITLPNEASVALHEAFGFKPVGVYRRIGWKAGGWRDVGWWQVELLAPSEGKPPEPGPPAHPHTPPDPEPPAHPHTPPDPEPPAHPHTPPDPEPPAHPHTPPDPEPPAPNTAGRR